MAAVASTAWELFEEQYRSRTSRSRELFEEAREHLAGGVPGNAGYREPYPLYVREAKGTTIVDVDGNEYIDLLIGGGPHLLGHSPPAVMNAVRRQLDRGTSTIAPHEASVALARKIKQHVPGMERLRFVHTGSEAVHFALRTARAFTGREKVGKFEGNFHGGYDNVLVSGTRIGGPEERPDPVAECAGIPSGILADTVVLPYNSTDAAVALIERHAGELAAVVVEPVGGTWLGGVAAEPGFLPALREVTAEHGIVLIFDEVITGFRLGLAGGAGLYGVTPDLTALAKAIGGGFPLGAFGGRADIMDAVVSPAAPDPRGKIFHSGTYQSNLVSATAGLAMLAELEKPGVHDHLDRLADRLKSGLTELGHEFGFDLQAIGVGSIVGVYFGAAPIRSIRDVIASDRVKAATFYFGLVANGVYITPYHLAFTNAAQSDEHIESVLETAGEVLRQMRQAAKRG